MKIPNIKTPLPGPKAKAIIERDEKFTAPAYGRVYPLVVKEGRGCVIEDRWLEEVSVSASARIVNCPAGQKPRAFLPAVIDVARNFFSRRLID